MPYAAFSAGAIGNMIYCTLRATWPWSSGATCIAHAYRLINRSGRIRMCRLDVYIKPFAASAGAHVNACRALRAAVGKCRYTCQCIRRAHSRHRQVQVHMSMHAARLEPPSASVGAHANACRTLRAASDKRRCTYQRIPCAHSRHRQARVHMPTHAARSKPLSAIAGAHINACRALIAASGNRRCTYQRMPRAQRRQWKRRRNIS